MKKRVISCAALLLAMVLLFFPMASYLVFAKCRLLYTPVLKEQNIEQAFENIKCSSVRIQGNGYYGSGSIFLMTEEEMIIVTNRHVLDYFDAGSYVTFYDGKQAKGNIIGSARKADVGFISISLSEFDYEELWQYRNVRKHDEVYDTLQKNDCFFMVDLANNIEDPVYYEGSVIDANKYLADFDMEMFYGDGYAVPGMSGSGIFDGYGNYLGILAGGTAECEIAAVPLWVVEKEYEKIK